MRARVFVTLKPSVFDPQGRTIADALHSLGYGGVEDVRQGKYFELDLATTEAGAGAERWPPRWPTSCWRIRSIESYRIEVGLSGSSMKFAVIVFPGSNCDHDAYHAATDVLGQQAELVWHKDTDLKGADVVILPGGFAHGDYLRTGAMARFSPIMRAVQAFADRGGPVLGICNGFQILLEAGLLPGAMLRNRGLKFRCEHVHVRVEQTDTPFTCGARVGQVLRIPIGHGEGNYYAPPDVLERLEANRQVDLPLHARRRAASTTTPNPNGSVHAIAGICNEARNVVGMMPHPERACEAALGGTDGLVDPRIHREGAWHRHDIDTADARTARPQARRVRAHRRVHGPRAEPDRARHLLGDVVRALQLQELARAPANAADRRAAGAAGPRRERRRDRHRRRPGRRLQDRIAQPPVVHRAVPGRGDRRRRHHPRHLHDGRAADRADELAALRRARGARHASACSKASSPASPATATASAFRPSAARSAFEPTLRRQSAGQRVLPRHRQGVATSSRASPRASATRSTTSARRPAATASTARRWRRRSSTRSRPRSGRRCRSAIRSWRSCCSRRASR